MVRAAVSLGIAAAQGEQAQFSRRNLKGRGQAGDPFESQPAAAAFDQGNGHFAQAAGQGDLGLGLRQLHTALAQETGKVAFHECLLGRRKKGGRPQDNNVS